MPYLNFPSEGDGPAIARVAVSEIARARGADARGLLFAALLQRSAELDIANGEGCSRLARRRLRAALGETELRVMEALAVVR